MKWGNFRLASGSVGQLQVGRYPVGSRVGAKVVIERDVLLNDVDYMIDGNLRIILS
jgi:hypothetical protein